MKTLINNSKTTTQTAQASKDTAAKDMLRDMAFILRMTKQVKDDILSTRRPASPTAH